ncbi:MAG: cohesin domain-containing protein [Candidatus Pacebacteria bacterium]|nr:cohesin domain-containing protein [Candidatus Paceibacterota bacterium]
MRFSLTPIIIFSATIIFGLSGTANAATFSINISNDTFKIGDQFNADIKINSEDVGVNAAQATIKFSPAVLEVASIDKTGSVFNFWIQDPKFANDDGEITFIGGASSGLIGKSLQVIRVVFRAKGLGQSDLIFIDGAVTASDGSGTNVLSAMNKSTVNITSTAANSDTEIQTIERTPIISDTSPSKPNVKVLLYPDGTKWYNVSSKFSASWQLPSDISAVATALNRDPAFDPNESGGIFDNETFSALSDGVWYLHVRFYNNIGWSATNHYRLAIDTVPPSPFEIKFSDSQPSDNPTPAISYQVNDQLSGIDYYYIKIDNNELITTNAKSFTLPQQKPGKHIVKVGAQDKAGNKVENTAEFEILPIEPPKIISVTTNVFSGEGELTISGTSLAKASILLEVKDQKNNLVYSFKTNSDEGGKWAVKIDSPLKNGNYYIEATAQDDRGASSLAIRSEEIRARPKPIIQIGAFQLGASGAALFLLLTLLIGFGGGIWFYRKRQQKLALRVELTISEITKIFKIITQDAEALYKFSKAAVAINNEYALQKLREDIAKMELYLKKGVEKIKK